MGGSAAAAAGAARTALRAGRAAPARGRRSADAGAPRPGASVLDAKNHAGAPPVAEEESPDVPARATVLPESPPAKPRPESRLESPPESREAARLATHAPPSK